MKIVVYLLAERMTPLHGGKDFTNVPETAPYDYVSHMALERGSVDVLVSDKHNLVSKRYLSKDNKMEPLQKQSTLEQFMIM
jgi:hypothetical protein